MWRSPWLIYGSDTCARPLGARQYKSFPYGHSSLQQLLPSCISTTRPTALIGPVAVAAGVAGGAILPSAAQSREVFEM